VLGKTSFLVVSETRNAMMLKITLHDGNA